jgi:hypothetical protein
MKWSLFCPCCSAQPATTLCPASGRCGRSAHLGSAAHCGAEGAEQQRRRMVAWGPEAVSRMFLSFTSNHVCAC